MALDAKIPPGEMKDKWNDYKGHVKLVNPANKRKLEVIVVGTGLAGASAAASLGEMGYKVKAFCFQDSPRRAHSIAAQGGINAAKNYQNDGDSVFRLFYDTVKGGDYRAREGNVHSLAEVSSCNHRSVCGTGCSLCKGIWRFVKQPFFWWNPGADVHFMQPAKPVSSCYWCLQCPGKTGCIGNVKMYSRHEMLDVVMVDGKARGIIARDLVEWKTGTSFRSCGTVMYWWLWKRFLPQHQCHGQ
jgi:succinate dehydrogenase / fumarate reductase flavoprotein subunit